MSVASRTVSKALCAILLSAGVADSSVAEESSQHPGHYLFAYFIGNGEDGLHLAHSTDGLSWRALNGGKSLLRPTAGGDRLMRDPSIVRGPDGTFHMVWTVSWGERVIGYSSSPNLLDWAPQRAIPVMEHEADALNCWAPELFYDDRREKFLIFWATTIPGRFPETDGQDGRQYNHRMYVTTTRDFQQFSPTRLFYDHGFNVIDAAIFEVNDVKGNDIEAHGVEASRAEVERRYAMLIKDETNRPFPVQKNIRIAFADEALGPYGPPSEPITGDYWAEGPTPLRVDDRWYVYFDKYRQHQYGVVASTDVQNWTDLSDQLTMPPNARHGTAFAAPEAIVDRLLRLE